MEKLPMYMAKATVAASELNGGAVLLDLEQSRYFGLNPVGELIWRELASPRNLNELCDAVCSAFDVSRDVCEKDVARLLTDLHDRDLIERHAPPGI